MGFLGPWWCRWVHDGFFGSMVVSLGPWWDQETSVLCHGVLDPVEVVEDQAVDPWLPRLPTGVVAPGDDALQHPVAYQGSPRVTLGTKGAVMGPGPWPPDWGGHLATGEGDNWSWTHKETWLWGRRWLWGVGMGLWQGDTGTSQRSGGRDHGTSR